MLLCAPVAAGLAAALTASLRAASPAGALVGVVLLLAGYLAAGAVQLRALTGATTVPAAHAALATAAGHWTLTAAALGLVPPPIMGKLATVANCIVDRGELCLPGEGASLSEHSIVLIRPDAPGSRGRQVLGQFVSEPA